MSSFVPPPPVFGSSIPASHFAEHNSPPAPTALRRVAHTYNQVAVSRRKILFFYTYPPNNTPAPTGTSVQELRFAFRAGENAAQVGCLIGMAPASQTSGTNSAYTQLNIDDGTPAAGAFLYHPTVKSGAYLPSEVAWRWSQATINPNSLYSAYIQQAHYARIHSVMVYEIARPIADSSIVGVANPLNWEADKPIYDAAVQDLAETGTKLWQHNGSMLLAWSRHTEATQPTVTSTSYVNLIDQSVSTVTASSPGLRINTQYHDTQSGDVPVEIAVYATRTAGTGTCSIKLVDSSGTLLEETGVTSGTLYTVAKTITAKPAKKTDIHVKVNTAGATWTWRLVCMWEYEA